MASVLADSWYAPELSGAAVFADVLPAPLRALADRNSIARGILLATFGLRYDTVVTTNPNPGAAVLIALYGLLGRRRVVLLEYIVHPPSEGGRVAALKFALRRRLVPRALRRAQVLTAAEVDDYAQLHSVPSERFVLVRWPRRFDDSPLRSLVGGNVVVASGRRTDWETFLTAARRADWTVRVVCTAADLPLVQRLAPQGADIRHDISSDEHQAIVESATVYVLPVAETGASIGQIRVMNAAQAGVPLVASAVAGLAGYVDADTAVSVPPEDPVALRDAVNALLADPDERERLRRSAREGEGGGSTMADYLQRIDALVHGKDQ